MAIESRLSRARDRRHSYASQAAMQGIPQPVDSRLLGHRNPPMTLRYAHVGDHETAAAAERTGAAIACRLSSTPPTDPAA